MAVPKRKVTPMRRGNRRSHDALSTAAYHEDKTTGELGLRHRIVNGFYRGRQVIKPKAKSEGVAAETAE